MPATLLARPSQPTALDAAVQEAALVQHLSRDTWRGLFSVNWRPDGKDDMRQLVRPVARMADAIGFAFRTHHDCNLYVAQHSYAEGTRRTDSLLSLNLAHVDLDVYKSAYRQLSPEKAARTYVQMLVDAGIPAPSYIVASGQGLQAKWLWVEPLTPRALPRWQAAHKVLIEHESGELFGADPKAMLPTQLMRLVGSTHQTSQAKVRIVWCNGPLESPRRYEFDDFCRRVLPWTREQVSEFRARMASYKVWDKENATNRALSAAAGLSSRAHSQARKADWQRVAESLGITPNALAAMDDLVASEIWQRRLDTMDRIIAVRYGQAGVPADNGLRHEWAWVAANAFAWVNRGQVKPAMDDTLAWARKRIPSYTTSEVRSAAAAVFKRAHEAGHGRLYRMHEETWRAKLGITDDERALTCAANARAVDEGAMGFAPMRGLSFGDYKAEVSRRQSESARRTNDIRRSASTPRREEAIRLHGRSLTCEQIADAVGVNRATVWRWLKR